MTKQNFASNKMQSLSRLAKNFGLLIADDLDFGIQTYKTHSDSNELMRLFAKRAKTQKEARLNVCGTPKIPAKTRQQSRQQ